MKMIRIGSGAGYGGDRLEPALTLLADGGLDYLCLECLAERTIALAQREKSRNPEMGYNELLVYRMERILPLAREKAVTVISNMGAANPLAAGRVVRRMASEMGLEELKVAVVLGDDITDRIGDYADHAILETGEPLGNLPGRILSANAYLGIGGILEALQKGADMIITGRVADPSLFLAPMVHEFGWNDPGLLGQGTVLGHLLECAGQLTGGYYADPGKKDIPGLWNLGFPFAEVAENGDAIVSKVPRTGGVLDVHTCTEQLLYEIHDPRKYITPDCVADFSRVELVQSGKDRVAVSGGWGIGATDTYKVSVGYTNGYAGVGEISYGGPNCLERATLAADVIRERLRLTNVRPEALKFDYIGLNSLYPYKNPGGENNEIRLRVAGKTARREDAIRIGNEMEALYTNGPAGGGGATKSVEELISVASILVPKSEIQPNCQII